VKLDQEIFKYLKGEKFSNSLSVEYDRTRYEAISREAAITGLIKDSNVIHIGCTDHLPLIREKIANKKWLHKLITDNARKCIGIDIDMQSIEYVKNETGYENVICGDILTDDFPEITAGRWDYAVFGEIIEHIDDPVHFLRTFRQRFGSSVNGFIITVPNIYNKQQFRNMLKYREVINSDHRYWFTSYTISKILVAAGYTPEKIIFSNLNSLTRGQLIVRKIRKLAGMKIRYPFHSFKILIVTGKLS
jgi:hypothetical protein